MPAGHTLIKEFVCSTGMSPQEFILVCQTQREKKNLQGKKGKRQEGQYSLGDPLVPLSNSSGQQEPTMAAARDSSRLILAFTAIRAHSGTIASGEEMGSMLTQAAATTFRCTARREGK